MGIAKNSRTSFFTCIFIALCILVFHHIMRQYQYGNYTNVLSWDVFAYYIYLPFTFIYDDPGISNMEVINHIFETYNPSPTFYQAYQLENGNHSPMYTIGMAIFYAPCFFIAHVWALLSDYPADGFSYPYNFCIANGMMVYIILGIFMVRKVLKHYFSDIVTSITLLMMLLGTTYFHQTIADEVGPHALMFSCFATILYLNIKWHENPTNKTAFLLGLVTGLALLARGSGIVLGFIPLLWNVYDKQSFYNKIEFIKQNFKSILVGAGGLVVIPLIQIIYWKAITGHFIHNTYQVTPGFDWLEPHILKVFFSYRKGWFLYTPMIAFVFIGVAMLWKKNKNIALAIILFFVTNIYLITSWGTWWQGNSFGCRYFVESYAILVIPLGYFVQWAMSKRWRVLMTSPLIGFFLFLNLFMTWQYNNWMFDGYTMTKEYFWKVFLSTEVTEEDKKWRGVERTFAATDEFKDPENYTKRTIMFMDFDDHNTMNLQGHFLNSDSAFSGNRSCFLTKDHTYGPTFKIHWEDMTDREHVWIKVSCKYLVNHDLKESPVHMVVQLNHNSGQYIEKYRSYGLETSAEYAIGKWNHFEKYYLTPYPLSTKNDKIEIYPYLLGDQPVYIDDFKVDIYERKW